MTTVQEDFKLARDKVGLTMLHEQGFTGIGFNVMNCESYYEHGAGTANILIACCPGSKHFLVDTSAETDGDILIGAWVTTKEGVKTDLATYVKQNKIDVMTVSKKGMNNDCEGWNKYIDDMQKETGVIIVCAAANEGLGDTPDESTISTWFPWKNSIITGALNPNTNRAWYSSVGEELDFMMYAPVITGTSAAAPMLAGLIVCIMDRYRKMTPAEMYLYLVSICKDLGIPGDDNYYGEGLPIMPDKTRIEVQIGSDRMIVNGITFTLDQAPEIDKDTNRTMVPLRAIAEGFGAKVTWIDATDTIILED